MLQWLDGGIDMSKDNNFIEIADMLADKYPHFMSGNTLLLKADCNEVMALLPDGFFDLAITDPPYGVSQPAFRKESKNKLAVTKIYKNTVYTQKPPDKSYFYALKRISANQIIWGGNYFCDFLTPGKKWIFWDKGTELTQWGDGELAYTSFPGAITKFQFDWNGMLQGNMKNKEVRIHPTQKPKALYDWLLLRFAKPGQLIFDSHGGSFSSAIASHYFGTFFIGTENDIDHFYDAVARFKQQTAQVDLLQEFA
jgi:site-specific DNA-methyltransferase (adenine-specific)